MDKIKELDKPVGQLIKLTDKVIELIGQITLLIPAIKTVVELF